MKLPSLKQQFGSNKSSDYLTWGIFLAASLVASNFVLDKITDFSVTDAPFNQSN